MSPESTEHQHGTEISPNKATLLTTADVIQHTVSAYLDSETLALCTIVCRQLKAIFSQDDIWCKRCFQDWGEDRRVLPDRSTIVPSYLATWQAWRHQFARYHAPEVRRVSVWWTEIEKWTKSELPDLEASLNPGVTEEELDRAEEQLGWPLAVHLRLLYRFHNGQWLPWDSNLDTALGIDTAQPTAMSDLEGEGRSLGLFGGYSFYNHGVSAKMFSLERGVVASLYTIANLDGENRDYFQANAIRCGTTLEQIRERGGFLLAGSHNMAKRAWVGRDGNVRFDPRVASLLGIFDGAPVDASPSSEKTACAGNLARTAGGSSLPTLGEDRPDGNVMTWLEEYLRRIRERRYSVGRHWPCIANGAVFAIPGAVVEKIPGIWLFPREGKTGCSTEITRGVKIDVSPVLVPESCTDWTEMTWAYCVRMRLLRHHPSRPANMTSCQLRSRHWVIDGAEGFHREISGDGVLGDHPILTVHDSSAFQYESCTTLEHWPGSMKGHLTFVPGTNENPEGHEFRVAVPSFELAIPAFNF